MAPKVWYIPPKKEAVQKTVGIYCRVSSNKKDQLNSLTAQISALVKCIAAVPQWSLQETFIDIAPAKGEEPRKEFDRMIRECEAKTISIILTKSISRFGRDTVETLDAVRRLKDAGTRIIFMEENIDTADYDSTLMISALESFAQEENESRSENIRWGLAKRAANGSSGLYKRKVYGYAKDRDGNLVIDDKQADVVRKIYKLYLEGQSVLGIIDKLLQENISSPSGRQTWSKRTIENILGNEKYIGTVTLSDSATGEYQYRMEEAHPAIISETVFRQVQEEKKKRSNVVSDENGNHRSSKKYSKKQHLTMLEESEGNSMAQVIKTRNELEFAVFCIENLASSLHTDASRVYKALNDNSDILKSYIVPEYEVLHTQSKEYILSDIQDVMRERGVVV